MKGQHTAEDWVSIARKFGEESVSIQHDSKLNFDQKLEKQKILSHKMTKEIEENSHLTAEDKRQMIESIHNYMNEWKSLHEVMEEDKKKEKIAGSKK